MPLIPSDIPTSGDAPTLTSVFATRETLSTLAGTLSFIIWLFAQSPQVITNYRRRSVDGLSLVFLFQWMAGDALNFIGCVLTGQLACQIAVSAWFVLVDTALAAQVWLYARGDGAGGCQGDDDDGKAEMQGPQPSHALAHAYGDTLVHATTRPHDQWYYNGARGSYRRAQSYSVDPARRRRGGGGATIAPRRAPFADMFASVDLSRAGRTHRRDAMAWSTPSLRRSDSSTTTRTALMPGGSSSADSSRASSISRRYYRSGATSATATDDDDEEEHGDEPRRGRGWQRAATRQPPPPHVPPTVSRSSSSGTTTSYRSSSIAEEAVRALSSVERDGSGSSDNADYFSHQHADAGVALLRRRPNSRSHSQSQTPRLSALHSRQHAHPHGPVLETVLSMDDGDVADAVTVYRRDRPRTSLRTKALLSALAIIVTLTLVFFVYRRREGGGDEGRPHDGHRHKGPAPTPPHASMSELIGRISSWTCTVLYMTSRLPQIWTNHVRRSTEGISILLFLAAFCGNFFYAVSILSNPQAGRWWVWGRGGAEDQQQQQQHRRFLEESLPFLIGSAGTLVFDAIVLAQYWLFQKEAATESEGESVRVDVVAVKVHDGGGMAVAQAREEYVVAAAVVDERTPLLVGPAAASRA